MAQKICKECGTPVEATAARESFEKYGGIYCKEHRDAIETDEPLPSEEAASAPSAPQDEPEQQTYNGGDGYGDDVPMVNHPESNAAKSGSVINMIRSYVGDDVLQVFGPTGSGKSKFALECARQALSDGLKVFYLDTERNLTDDDIKSLKGCDYRYTPVLDEIDKMCQNLPKCDVVIIDSIGFPILTAYARYSMKQKGDALLKLIAIFGDLKQWAYKNNGLAIVTNQPESDFNKAPGHLIRPFGDKSQFACKEIWRTDAKSLGKTTKSEVRSFRSRSVGHKTLIANMEISDDGVSIVEASK